ncbi:OFA family oxalate/formate antiporter-like MFS transporter [Halarchaeum rubridurum]|uniref:MFS transporter n=1 Tax=Halarchaeum rubridurum TaxID=489911 RepID=A0A830FKN6_9EURY|nr:MFS transporter [Halarchaeum rubridurum]MBP1954814.1 OFA family oxalate/formate antiporter-like MFS transporter [Halarchaeum rubridurum]GGM59942.1 MFS transporter [Halarchaeum rubridurum]
MDRNHGARAREVLGFSRWWLVAAAAGMMAVVGPYQYVWSSLRSPVARHLGVDAAMLSTVFTLFVVFQAGSQFPVGWWRDRHGPRGICALAAALAGGGYVALASASTVWQVYLAYSLGAVGVGIVYTVAVNTALKWFPDRRGLTSGVGTMAFAAGPAALVPVVRAVTGPTAPDGAYVSLLRAVGLGIFVVVLAGAFVIRDPPEGWLDGGDGEASLREEGRQYTWREMLRTWQFWLMYAMFVAVSGSGLMLTEKIVDYADHLGLAAVVATLAATLLPLSSAVGRLVLGEAADRLDPVHTMASSFVLCGLGLFAVVHFGIRGTPAVFVTAVVVATFFWSPKYTLFPSVVAEYYGTDHSSANYALLYSGKIWGGVLGGTVTGVLVTSLGWNRTFLLGGALAVVAGVAALFLRPPEDATVSEDGRPADAGP